MRKVHIALSLVVFVGVASSAWAGTTYVNFDDGTAGSLMAYDNWFGTATVQFSNQEAVITSTVLSSAQGAGLVFAPSSPLTGDFTAEMTFTTNVDTLAGLTATMMSGIIVPVSFTTSVAQASPETSTRGAYCGPTYVNAPSAAPSDFVITPVTNAIVSQGSQVREPVREVVPSGVTRMSLKLQRVGTTLSLSAAYNANATTPTKAGNFHHVATVTDMKTIGDAGVGMIAFAAITIDGGAWQFGVDDVIITGSEIPTFGPTPPPEEEPEEAVAVASGLGLMLLTGACVLGGALVARKKT